MNLLEASMKVGRVTRSATTDEQHESAKRYRALWNQHLERENDKFNPVAEAVALIAFSFFALIGIITVLYVATH